MHVPKVRRVLVAGLAAALVCIGVSIPADPAAAAAKASAAKHNVDALCGVAKPGHSQCFALRRLDVKAHKGIQPALTVAGYGPGDLPSAYDLPADGGAGQTVAIVDAFDDPNAEADLAVYRSAVRAARRAPPPTAASARSTSAAAASYPPPDAGWAGEISLDLDMVSAVAPERAHPAGRGGRQRASTTSARRWTRRSRWARSTSPTATAARTPRRRAAARTRPRSPTSTRTTTTPASRSSRSTGDDGYGVSYPAASQYVTAVGGTSPGRGPAAPAAGSESVWNNSFGGPGSGCSLYEAKPALQTDTGCAKRTEADVSAVADPETGVAVYDTYQATRLERLRRHQRVVADHRGRLRRRRHPGRRHLPDALPVRGAGRASTT